MKINFKNGSYTEEICADSNQVRGKRVLIGPLVFDYEKVNPEEVDEVLEIYIKELNFF